jgi:tetratricopeptide (TPR) repeat protein
VRTADEDQRLRLYLLEGELLRSAGMLQEAMAFYSQRVEEDPDNTSFRYARALVAERLDNLKLAEQDLRYIIEREPANAQALNALGYTLADRTDRFQEALQLIERALEVEPEDGVIIDSFGWVQYRLGNLAKAEEYLRRALDLVDDPEVAAHLGEVLWMMGNKQDAIKIWKEFLEKHPDHEGLLNVMKRFGL